MIEDDIRPLPDKYVWVVCITFNVFEHYSLIGEGEIFQSSPYGKELFTLYGKLAPEAQGYLLITAKELLKVQQKLLHEGESRHLYDEKRLSRYVHME